MGTRDQVLFSHTLPIIGTVTFDAKLGAVFHMDHPCTLIPGEYTFTLQRKPDLRSLRSLRLYHWRQVMRLAALRTAPQTKAGATLRNEQYDMHMKAVQSLNELFPSADTAERDAALEDGLLR